MKDVLTTIDEIEQIEKSKQAFKLQLSAITSSYFKTGQITFSAPDYGLNDDDNLQPSINIDFDTELMIKYIKSEIISLTSRSNKLIERLSWRI